MIVVEKAKSLAMHLDYPERVLEVIPNAKRVTLRGQELVVTPHDLGVVRVLNNMGIKAPSPILHYYDWAGGMVPYEHQRQTAAFLTTHRKALVLNDIGTGKTMAALWAADYMMQIGIYKRVLIFAPLSTLESVWGNAIYMRLIHRNFAVMHGTAAKRKKLLKEEHDFYIINHEGFPIIADDCNGRFDLVIVDEAAIYRNPASIRFRTFRRWMERNSSADLWLMTGTPTPDAPTNAWTLGHLVGNPLVPRSFTTFRDQVMYKVGMWQYVPRDNAVETVSRVLQPSVRFKRDDCVDLPDTVVQTRQVLLTAEQDQHYKRMLKNLITDFNKEGTITAVNEAVKLMKLVQIACGVAYGDEGQQIHLPCAPRVAVVKELIEQSDGKVIVFVPLTGTLNMLAKELRRHWSVEIVDGSVSSKARTEIFHKFQNDKDPHVIVAHPGTMSHGLTLTAASTIVWYGPITSNETYLQANGRVERIGKRHVSNIIHITSTALERSMYARLEKKQTLQGLLLEVIQGAKS